MHTVCVAIRVRPSLTFLTFCECKKVKSYFYIPSLISLPLPSLRSVSAAAPRHPASGCARLAHSRQRGGTFRAYVLHRQNVSSHTPLSGKIRLSAPCGPKSPHAEARHTDVLRSLRPVRIRIKPHSANPSPSVQYGRRAAACNRSVRQADRPARGVRNILRRLRSKTAAPAGNSILQK